MLDLNDFRAEKGGDPEKIRESQRRRFAKVELVDEVITHDNDWRAARFNLDKLNREKSKIQKDVAAKYKSGEKADDLKEQIVQIEKLIEEGKKKETELKELLDKTIDKIGNIVHDSVPISKDEDNNRIERTFPEDPKQMRPSEGLFSHIAIMQMIDGVDTEKGAETAGNRGYYMKGNVVLLALAVIHYGLSFLSERGFSPLYTPFFMKKEIMAEVAQLEQFDEELYKVTGEGEDKYLIATSEQTICAFHRNEWLEPKALPIKYCGYSTCFRKEVGRHGQDTLGIFRIHQFEKLEQFCITSPEDSWAMQEEMIKNAEDFYKSLGVQYRIVNIVSGALNNAAAKKYDLEAWFPGSAAFRELVSCSNCTDYQSRNLEVRFGATKKMNAERKEYVHMLNSTLCAVQRFLCCLVETHQTPTGIVIPEKLRSYMGGKDFLPFVRDPPKAVKSKDAAPAKSQSAKPVPVAAAPTGGDVKGSKEQAESSKQKATATEPHHVNSK